MHCKTVAILLRIWVRRHFVMSNTKYHESHCHSAGQPSVLQSIPNWKFQSLPFCFSNWEFNILIMSQYWTAVGQTTNIDSCQSCARENLKRDASFNVSFLMAWKTTWPHIASNETCGHLDAFLFYLHAARKRKKTQTNKRHVKKSFRGMDGS